MKDSTLIVRDKIDFKGSNPISTPIFQTSAFRSGDPNFYSRNNNPNFEELEGILAKLDNASYSVLLSSGMAAISAVINLLKPGDELVICSLIYGCTYRFIHDFCIRRNIKAVFADITDMKIAQTKISKNTTMVFFESPTNPFLKTIDIRAITDLAQKKNKDTLIVVDNTWATPINQKPLDFGADIALYSGSKFFSGHSDIIIGATTTNNEKIYKKLREYRFYHGAITDAFSAWLTRRSMQTLAIRLTHHEKSTRKIVRHLQSHPMCKKVYYPEIDGRQLLAYGGLLFFRINVDEYGLVETFMNSLTLFDQGTSMASVASAVANPYNGSHLSMSKEEKNKIALDEFIIRLSIGLEDIDDLLNDIDQAFDKIS